MKFVGLEPWPEDYVQVELVQDGRLIDLHNLARFAGMTVEPVQESVRLAFEFTAHDDFADKIPARIRLVFDGVADLTVVPTEEEGREGDQLEGWDYFRGEDDLGTLVFEVGAMRVSFRAVQVAASTSG